MRDIRHIMESGSTSASVEREGEDTRTHAREKKGRKHMISIDMMPSSTREAAYIHQNPYWVIASGGKKCQ